MRYFGANLGLVVLFTVAASGAQAACSLPTWSGGSVPVNQEHVFCGEITGGTPKGYHSATVIPPAAGKTVVSISGIAPISNGLYNATPRFSNGSTKLSTFFPNACTQAQIVTSVQYAYAHNGGPVAPWGISGMSAPPTGGAAYCLNSAGQAFEIRMGTIGSGSSLKINTAFPR
ncbi:hypothetical protein VZ95_10075 [Elstera litoralis]|uniref:Bacterial EndoU nuclease domain-containing protein n=1 Tax=Elstera litoralis TaxID=552518 RepID=A0A0F3IVN8_9PROT|nr:EndoU domain-containing protein [Elstera litoralis]KJV09659.1 hypothetical protein VZ95_10075 [Elstera litoralis]